MAEHDTAKNSAATKRPDNGERVAPGRRRLLHGGLAAGPVLMTLVSRPVLSAVVPGQCTTPSGYVSLNASTAGRGVSCSGHTAAFWSNPLNFSQWPAPYYPTGASGHQPTQFNDVFSPPLNGNPTLLAVLSFTGSATNDVAKAVVVALLNVAAGLVPVLSISAIKDIWSEFATTGFFSPSAGAQWNAAEIIDYLSTTVA
jgi:hypothetical protein